MEFVRESVVDSRIVGSRQLAVSSELTVPGSPIPDSHYCMTGFLGSSFTTHSPLKISFTHTSPLW